MEADWWECSLELSEGRLDKVLEQPGIVEGVQGVERVEL